MAREQQGDDRFFQKQPRPPLSNRGWPQSVNDDDHTFTIKQVCHGNKPNVEAVPMIDAMR